MMARCDTAISLEVPASARAPGLARGALDGIVDRLRPQVFEDGRLLLSELVTNSVRHGGLGEPERISIHIRLIDHRLRVEVSDRGLGFVGALRGRRDSEPGAGWGLSILERVAARWGIAREQGTSVWFELDDACSGYHE